MSNPSPAAVVRTPRLLVWLALPALLAYALFLGFNASVAAGGSDTSGYLNSARLLASGRLQTDLRVPAEFGPQSRLPRHHFMPLGFVALPGNPHLPPTYPVGLPLQLAVVGKFLGLTTAALVVELALALGALGLCYAVARELGVDPWLAASGVVVLAVFPVFLFTSLQPLSDTPATTWCLLSFWLALRAGRSAHPGWVVACGAAFALTVFVRATNLVLLPALLVLLGAGVRRIAFALLGGLPGALWLAYYNHTLYGGALESGYGAIEETFALSYGPPTLKHFAYWLAVLTPAVFLALPLLSVWQRCSREVLALLLWFGAITGVYTFYEVSRETWWCLRFILPAFPALILLGLLGIEAWVPRRRAAAAAALALWAVACSVYWTPRLHVLLLKRYETVYADACLHARAILPPNALVTSFYTSGALYFYTDFPVLRWDQIESGDFTRYEALAQAAGRPIYAMLFDELEIRTFRERTPGDWSRVSGVGSISLWRFTGPPKP